MTQMNVTRMIFGLVALSFVVGCRGPKEMRDDQSGGPTTAIRDDWPVVSAPRRNVFLRATFDQDPRHLMGRFIQKGKERDGLDEDMSVQSKCSKYITSREVRANQTVVEKFNASNEVEASVGFDPGKIKELTQKANIPDAEVDVDNERDSGLVVEYTVTRKLISEVSDPEAFEACCDSDSRACSNLYIGEFIAGTGSVYVKNNLATGVGAGGGAKGIGAKTRVHNGWTWAKSTSFEDSYFAFRVYDTYLVPDNWEDEIPFRDGGQYFVGVSPEAASEDIARDMAMRHARTQAIKFIGTQIEASSKSTGDMFNGYTEDERVVKESAEGIAKFLKGRKYKTERIETTKGWKWKVKVLTWFPESSYAPAAEAVVDAAIRSGKADPDAKKKILRVVDDFMFDARDGESPEGKEEGTE